MKHIGTIQQLQIQRHPLKTGESPNKTYDPSPLLIVDALRVTHQGTIGLTADGGELMDAHHINHPQSRNRKNANGISIGFTSNYSRMRDRFGLHLTDGSAGENIIISPAFALTADDLYTDIIIETTNGHVHFVDLMVAAPCNAFSRFCLQNPDAPAEDVKAALQFLGDGMRGFYATLSPQAPPQQTIYPGDKVYIP